MRRPFEDDLYKDYSHHVIEVDDLEGENVIESFAECNGFIQQGLDGGGGVLVHCAMGRSRSATFLIAYLLFTDPDLTPVSALSLLRQVRPLAEPNPGFMTQLALYHRMGCPSDLDAQALYQRWCWDRRVTDARARAEAPNLCGLTLDDERKEGEGAAGTGTEESEPMGKGTEEKEGGSEFRCRRCRRHLATSSYLLSTHGKKESKQTGSAAGEKPCSHHWLDQPLSWMREEMEAGKLEGRLECPNEKCKTLVGRYSWQGMRCSCGQWVVPGISLAVGKVDESRARIDGSGGKGSLPNA